MIHKKGDVENVGNYCAICSLPALYKLFLTILYRRLYPRLDRQLAEGQAGFRSSYQTTDHLATYRMIEQKCHEWGNQNVDSNNRLHGGIRLHYTQIILESTQILRYQTRLHQPPEEDLQRQESNCTHQRRDQHVRDQERNRTWWSSVKLAFQHGLHNLLNDDIQRWKKKKGMESTWVTTTMSASRNWCLPTACSCLHPPKNSFKKCCANSSKVLKKWVSGSTQRRWKFSVSKAA